jgi:type IV pilus assembly protein PilA
MSVVALIGILAAIALPAYQGYTDKAKFTEETNATAAAKTAVEVCVQITGALTACDQAAEGIPATVAAASGIVGLTTSAGVITATAATNSTLTGATFTLTPTVATAGNVTWVAACSPATLC